jgi:hypothetical protein
MLRLISGIVALAALVTVMVTPAAAQNEGDPVPPGAKGEVSALKAQVLDLKVCWT